MSLRPIPFLKPHVDAGTGPPAPSKSDLFSWYDFLSGDVSGSRLINKNHPSDYQWNIVGTLSPGPDYLTTLAGTNYLTDDATTAFGTNFGIPIQDATWCARFRLNAWTNGNHPLEMKNSTVSFRALTAQPQAQIYDLGPRGTTTLQSGVWYHLVCRYEQSSGDMEYWWQGSLNTSANGAGISPALLGGHIGNSGSLNIDWFNLGFWHRRWSDQEIADYSASALKYADLAA